VTPARWSALRKALEGQQGPPSFPIDDKVLLAAKQRVALAVKVRRKQSRVGQPTDLLVENGQLKPMRSFHGAITAVDRHHSAGCDSRPP